MRGDRITCAALDLMDAVEFIVDHCAPRQTMTVFHGVHSTTVSLHMDGWVVTSAQQPSPEWIDVLRSAISLLTNPPSLEGGTPP